MLENYVRLSVSCSFNYANAKTFYRSFNASFGCVVRSASEEVVLMKVKCLPVLLCGIEARPINIAARRSLEFTAKSVMIKLFCTYDNSIISSCVSFLVFRSERACVAIIFVFLPLHGEYRFSLNVLHFLYRLLLARYVPNVA